MLDFLVDPAVLREIRKSQGTSDAPDRPSGTRVYSGEEGYEHWRCRWL